MSSKVSVNKWLLIFGIIFFCLAIVAVGLGVYFGVRCTSSENNESTVTTLKPTTTTINPAELRLPTNLKPSDYYLTIRTFIPSPSGVSLIGKDGKNRTFSFDGDLTIHITCVEETNTIVLNKHEIEIYDAILTDMTGDVIQLADDGYPFNNVTQKVVFTLASGTLEAGKNYSLWMNYSGILNDQLAGFYRSSYEEDGMTKWLAVTQFEPTDARRALPCFDEPSFKAIFHLTLIHPWDMGAISNTYEHSPVNLTGDLEGWAQTDFDQTEIMSTYLFAMCVSTFVMKNETSHYGVNFRVWARETFIDDAWWALQAGPQALTYYADYFGIDFPLLKQDMVALPDFGAGAMENWGMITYRERDLLYNNATYGSNNLQRTTIVVAHELAHQWFGDLVTLAWWDDLWLNEGFAEFMEYKGADNISNNEFDMKFQFVPLEIDLFMALDQLTSSHPIYDPALQTPDEINSAFDDISYDKGAAVIHQLEFTVGEDVFRKGLHEYLSSHEYSNANHQDLWDAIQWAVYNETENQPMGWDNKPLNVTEFMNPWILQMGFPVVNVDTKAQTMKQSRFLLPGNFSINPQYQTSVYNFTWYIPVRYTIQGTTDSDLTWIQPYQTTPLPKVDDDKWIVVNSGVYGLYRVNYDPDNWQKVIRQLQDDPTVIDPRNRAQMLDDALNLARTGQLPYNVSLDLTTYLKNEYSYIPWMSVGPNLAYLQNMFALLATNQYFGQYVRSLVSGLYYELGWFDEGNYANVTLHELRAFIIQTMCATEDTNCMAQALQYYKEQLRDNCNDDNSGTSNCSKVDTNLRHTVYCAGISQGTADDFNYLYAKYPLEQIAVERDNILYGLCCSKDPWALTKLLNEAVNPNSAFIRSQDAQYVFMYIGNNDVGREILWDYFVTNFQQISDSFASGSFSLATIVTAVTQSFNTPTQVAEMQQFLIANSDLLGSGLTAFVQQLELAQSNVVWMDNYSDDVIQWIQDYLNTLNH